MRLNPLFFRFFLPPNRKPVVSQRQVPTTTFFTLHRVKPSFPRQNNLTNRPLAVKRLSSAARKGSNAGSVPTQKPLVFRGALPMPIAGAAMPYVPRVRSVSQAAACERAVWHALQYYKICSNSHSHNHIQCSWSPACIIQYMCRLHWG